jgi:hypothetical protein
LIEVDAVDPNDIHTLIEELRRARIFTGAKLTWPRHRTTSPFLAS